MWAEARCATLAIATVVVLAACTREKSEVAAGEVDLPAATLTDVAISDYDLDMDRVRKWLAGTSALMAAAREDSGVAHAIEASGNETTRQSIARLEGNTRAKDILDKADISPSEYVMTMSAYLRAAIADAASRSSPKGLAPNDVNPKNVEFIRKHRAELNPLLKQAGIAGAIPTAMEPADSTRGG